MKIPSSFYYKGKYWTVSYQQDLHADDGVKCRGLCDTSTRAIYLDKDLPHSQRVATFLHELYHVLVHEAHIPPNVVLTDDIEDVLAEAFSDMLTSILKTGWRK